MPSGPKWNGMNRHAQEAAAREEQRRSEAKAKESKAREEASWADDGDSKQRKAEERRAEQQRKEEEQRRKKAQRDAEYEAELRAAEKSAPKSVVQRQMQKEVTRNVVQGSLRGGTDLSAPTDRDSSRELVARNNAARESSDGTESEARPPGPRAVVPEDRHIGKRARVAYRKFCELNLPILKEGQSGKALRRSQLNDLLWAMWQKSPENPFVVRAENRAEEALQRKWYEDSEDEGDDSDEQQAA